MFTHSLSYLLFFTNGCNAQNYLILYKYQASFTLINKLFPSVLFIYCFKVDTHELTILINSLNFKNKEL